MLDQSLRTAILELHKKGNSIRAIADALDVSRDAVETVIESGSWEVPRIIRPELADPWKEEIVYQYQACKGNLVRVHEEIVKKGAELSYQALTAYCRRHEIGQEPKIPSGRYDFKPGVEMQHDTSPHKAMIGGVLKNVQTASLVLFFSRMIFIQLYACFTRFECKIFLTAALKYFGASAARCMIDNTHVVVLRGTGETMIPVPEMEAFARRLGFVFVAHEKGDANRSARVEGPFDYVDNNFLAGRKFESWEDVNREAEIWCDKVNSTHSVKLGGSRRQLFATELPSLKPLPIWIPEVYMLRHPMVDTEGYVSVRSNRYSVPYRLIGRRMEVRELADRIDVYDGPRIVATHPRAAEPRGARITTAQHRPPRGASPKRQGPTPEEQKILAIRPELASYVSALKAHKSGRGTLPLRHLLRLVREYPSDALLRAVAEAEKYGLFDLGRLERLILKRVSTEYFNIPSDEREPEDDK